MSTWWLLFTLPLASSGGVSCGEATSTTINVSWDAVEDTDVYYIALASHAGAKPYALQTTASPKLTLLDLMPGQTYYIQMRSHPKGESIVWGWRAPTDEIVCKTTSIRLTAPHELRRLDTTPAEHTISVAWNHAADNLTTSEHAVGVRRIGGSWRWEPAGATAQHEFIGLAAGEEYEVVVRDEVTGEVSDSLVARTSSPGAVHTLAYRISEYALEVDFLDNHDGASLSGMPVYVQNGGAKNETALQRAENVTLDGCLAALRAHSCEGGTSFQCIKCADANRAAIVAACGNYSDGDSSRHGWGVHFHCGIGWPGSSFQRSPMTEYCVEHYPAPQTDPVPGGDGYAQYVSCNSDECDGALLPTGNIPRRPTCICWVWSDRMLSQQPASNTLAACDPAVKLPWAGATQCNCSVGKPGVEAAWLPPDAPMANYIGRSKVYLPYYRYDQPREHYPVSILVGDNLSFPRKTSCADDQRLGDGGCTWKRLPQSRMLYGDDLMAFGWNATADYPNTGGSIEEEIAVTHKNIASFNRALDNLGQYRTPRCCGC